MEDAGHTVVVIGNDLHICGLISVADGLRPQAPAAIRGLRAAGVHHCYLLTEGWGPYLDLFRSLRSDILWGLRAVE